MLRALCFFLGAGLVISLGCARDVGLVDRTQPGKLKKSAFEDEWYFRQTVVDVPYATGVTFIGEQSLMDRIRWEISENHLTAYRSYERVTDSEIPSQLPGTAYQGAPVAAFAILGHFDVYREYNPATGEQTNVLVENDFDRPWNERAYMRVDWSSNLLANFDFIAAGESGLGVRVQGASYAVTDPDDPDAPVFGVRTADGWQDERDPTLWGELDRFDYFDLTLKLQVTPDTFTIDFGDGSFEEWPSCWFYEYGPWDCASQTVKVRASFLKVPPSDFEPMYYPDNYIARDASGDPIRAGWDDQGAYRRCSAAEAEECPPVRIPMFDRFGYFRIEREVYDRDYEITEEGRLYLITRFNLWQQSLDAGGESIPYADRKLKPIVYHLSPGFPKELERAAQEVAAAWNEPFAETVNALQGRTDDRQVYKIVPNDFRVEDGKIVDHGQRNGDLRYNHLYWVDDPQFESLFGYGPSAADPLTGELIVADAYAYGGAIDSYAAMAADIVQLITGEIDEREFIEGENVSSVVSRLSNRPGVSRAQRKLETDRVMENGLGERLAALRHAGSRPFRVGYDYTASRLRLADGDPLFDALWSDEMRQAYERRFGRRLEPSEFGSGRLARALTRHRRDLGRRAIDFNMFDDGAILGVVDRLGGLSRENLLAELRALVFKSTSIHEIGHTLGLRHNFAGSSDALNYHDAYWDVRNPNAGALDMPSRNEMSQGLREHAYSSIMDYGAKFMSDIHGVGKYDRAAIKFGYGQLVEVFDNPPTWEEDTLLEYYSLQEAVHEWMHYTDIPDFFASPSGAGNGLENMRRRHDVPLADVVASLTAEDGVEYLGDQIVPFRFCSDEYVGARWDCDVWDEGGDPYEIVNYGIQSYWDYYVFRAFKRHRRFLDPFEYYLSSYYNTMLPPVVQYQLWIFDQWTKWDEWAWLADMDREWGTDVTENEDWNLDPHGGLSGTAAAMTTMNFFGEILATPEPGSYYQDPDTGVLNWWADFEDRICGPGEDSAVDDCSAVYIPLGDGRYAFSAYAEDSGYYWYERVQVVGSWWDKLAAVEAMADPTTYFLGVDADADYSTYAIGLNVAFPQATGTLFGAVYNDDYERFAPQLESNGSLSYPAVFESITDAYADQPRAPRPGPFVDPATAWSVSIYTLFYGMALLNAAFDQSFNDSAKIWIEGHGESIAPDVPPEDIASFSSPFNGRVYHAVRSPDPKAYSMGFEMVTRAEAMRQQIVADPACDFFGAGDPCLGVRWTLQGLIENMELVRGYYDIFGYVWF